MSPPAHKVGGLTRKAWSVILAAAAIAAAVIGVVLTRPIGPPLLPDLAMDVPNDLFVATEDDGRQILLMSAEIVNIGDGPLLIDGTYDRRTRVWTVFHTIRHTIGSTSSREVDAEVSFGGDGHNHFHILQAVRYRLTPLDSAVATDERLDRKVGFCFFDHEPYALKLDGAPQIRVYDTSGCGYGSVTSISMGMSVGWGDNYFWTLPGQSIDITGLPDGEYMLEYVADPNDWFEETDETNNRSWARIWLSSDPSTADVQILESGIDHDVPGSSG